MIVDNLVDTTQTCRESKLEKNESSIPMKEMIDPHKVETVA